MTKVFTNGCFDLIHPGHLEMIRYCASLGDHLLIGIDSDERVKKTKGDNRPINPESVRQKILLNFKWVNDVEIFSNDEELTNLIRSYNPDYMIVGSDWKGKHVIGSEYAKIVGFFERIDEFSTTEIIKRITTG
jgi:D-beta-D-heptose 7-phosphate kinase/D-beta-D-heptose 1-phosphate adenosyltransferase|tara:strand:+ start:1383 stop:1781 length:399 start_codon:yes stop_codon:yes gene_type:complete